MPREGPRPKLSGCDSFATFETGGSNCAGTAQARRHTVGRGRRSCRSQRVATAAVLADRTRGLLFLRRVVQRDFHRKKLAQFGSSAVSLGSAWRGNPLLQNSDFLMAHLLPEAQHAGAPASRSGVRKRLWVRRLVLQPHRARLTRKPDEKPDPVDGRGSMSLVAADGRGAR